MKTLSKKDLQLGGFAGLTEHRLVTDSRAFGPHKNPAAFEGIGNFVYLADAYFNPKGETRMHPHKEIDVISVMIDGRVSHAGSLEHGKSLETGDVQVQRAGGEGFVHNEINPDDVKNRMIQLWVLPEVAGEPAGYKYYSPSSHGVSRIYGGDHNQDDTFASNTTIDIARFEAGEQFDVDGEALIYVTKGAAKLPDESGEFNAADGDLIRATDAKVLVEESIQLIIVKAS